MITITVENYELQIESKGRIWLRNPEGEGMLVDHKQLKELLDKFWEYHF